MSVKKDYLKKISGIFIFKGLIIISFLSLCFQVAAATRSDTGRVQSDISGSYDITGKEYVSILGEKQSMPFADEIHLNSGGSYSDSIGMKGHWKQKGRNKFIVSYEKSETAKFMKKQFADFGLKNVDVSIRYMNLKGTVIDGKISGRISGRMSIKISGTSYTAKITGNFHGSRQ
ncbi:MAG: hypothetical protein HZA77_08310 [Candidatus Schekmanbacteria bacterium]|nr:hypothetical protein [Candidatus Schekmanbacteria bacterium]